MGKQSKDSSFYRRAAACRLVSVATVDEHGQMRLPKKVRDSAGILPGERLALVLLKSDADTNRLALVKVEDLTGGIRGILNPLADYFLQVPEHKA
jgi:AbrB family looped-hinge helix DNA binding protein